MEPIRHECGIALLRLRKPPEFYRQKYGTETYGLDMLRLMMEKEHHRGQEAAGVGCVDPRIPEGTGNLFRERAPGTNAIQDVFGAIHRRIARAREEGSPTPFRGDCYMGHLRYSTTGRSGMDHVHPFLRVSARRAASLMLCGNFNLTNVDELRGATLPPGEDAGTWPDTRLLLEQTGLALDAGNEDITEILKRNAPGWDGGYVICGMGGDGDLWALRDPNGIRPAFYYVSDEVVAVASERPVIQTTFNAPIESVRELPRGSCLRVTPDGTPEIRAILSPREEAQCSFERIYFSRGNDRDIYRERKQLGRLLAPRVMESIGGDIDHTVFSFVPNSAEAAYHGLTEELERLAGPRRLRKEKVVVKDSSLRTFIAESGRRENLASHIYDVTHGTLTPGKDNLVVIDDSIVRGTTLRQSVIRLLDSLGPRRIVVVSGAPQVRYPDCYGIDISRLGEFIAFRAAMALLKETRRDDVAREVYELCKTQEQLPPDRMENFVSRIYAPFSERELADKIARMLTPEGTRAEVSIVFQTVADTHRAIPGHSGDWYFSGRYPTPGGYRLLNRAYINFYEGRADER